MVRPFLLGAGEAPLPPPTPAFAPTPAPPRARPAASLAAAAAAAGSARAEDGAGSGLGSEDTPRTSKQPAVARGCAPRASKSKSIFATPRCGAKVHLGTKELDNASSSVHFGWYRRRSSMSVTVDLRSELGPL